MKSRKCEQIKAELLDYIEREMSSDERERVSEHLAECDDCNMEYEGLRAMLYTTKNLPIEDPGEEFWRQLPQKVLQEVRYHKKRGALNNVTTLNSPSRSSNNDTYDSLNNFSSPKRFFQTKTVSINRQTHFKAHRFTAAAAIAATLLLAINVMMLTPKSGYIWFDQARYQARIDTENALPRLEQTLGLTVKVDTMTAPLGFVDQHRTDKAYTVGVMLASSFAYLKNGRFQSALQQLNALQRQIQQPSQKPAVSLVTLSSIRKAKDLLQSPDIATNPNTRSVVAELLARFQSDYENLISQPQQLTLYRAGIWVFNASLAVAVQDSEALVGLDLAAQLAYLQKAFVRLNAPVGVRNSLQEIAEIVGRHSGDNASLSEKEFGVLRQELQNLNTLLG